MKGYEFLTTQNGDELLTHLIRVGEERRAIWQSPTQDASVWYSEDEGYWNQSTVRDPSEDFFEELARLYQEGQWDTATVAPTMRMYEVKMVRDTVRQLQHTDEVVPEIEELFEYAIKYVQGEVDIDSNSRTVSEGRINELLEDSDELSDFDMDEEEFIHIIEDLQEIHGFGDKKARFALGEGYESKEEIYNSSIEELVEIGGVGKMLARRILREAPRDVRNREIS